MKEQQLSMLLLVALVLATNDVLALETADSTPRSRTTSGPV